MAKCPVINQEHQQIRATHTTLASTGCTRDFCQAGRMIHSDEPRIGENRALLNVESEAQAFLSDLYREGFYKDETEFQLRLAQALEEIRAGAVEGVARQDQKLCKIGGNWRQTREELEFGVRRAWRNSRKCIMRSHCAELKLCDLRASSSSEQMAMDLIMGVVEAFNGGNIQPTVFVFPPRAINERGPMIMNNQVLQFAGYEVESGGILGDPASVDLTKAVIDLGWQPPEPKSRWDLLPLVTMANGDKPFMAELPPTIRKLIDIRHPQYPAQFEKLDLKWVSFPALTRLGFDIGGIQYTAAPFIGWFMDAEVGVRDLADSFRYNVLPEVIQALGLSDGKYHNGVEEFEDLPEFEKLAILTRAQSELNYAVHWSYLQAKISMTDSLTASKKWCQYDDDFREKYGYRLPADPYWLAPPQGSIIPVWHRGGAPNYQPKPMISKHVQDPIKAWKREKHRWPASSIPTLLRNEKCVPKIRELPIALCTKAPDGKIWTKNQRADSDLVLNKGLEVMLIPPEKPNKSVAIYFCSAGTIAEKLSIKLHRWIKSLASTTPNMTLKPQIRPLNRLKLSSLKPSKVLLLVISSTGQGEIPNNGASAVDMCRAMLTETYIEPKRNFYFAIFGNGDSRYSSTFNGAALQVNQLLKQVGGVSIAGGLFKGDTAVEPLPLRGLKAWYTKLEAYFTRATASEGDRPSPVAINNFEKLPCVTVSVRSIQDGDDRSPVDDALPALDEYQQEVLSTLKEARMTAAIPQILGNDQRSRILSLDIAGEAFEEMSCVQVLPLNSQTKIEKALLALQIEGTAQIGPIFGGGDMNFSRFLREFVDLESAFSSLDWLQSLQYIKSKDLNQEFLSSSSVFEVLHQLSENGVFSPGGVNAGLRMKILLAMPLLQLRTYSIASSQRYVKQMIQDNTGGLQTIDIMVRTFPSGRFSSKFIQDSSLPATFKYRIVDSVCGPQIRKNYLAPFVIVATGAGFGPVCCLLQWRIAIAREAIAAGKSLPSFGSSISLFLGFKECDLDLVMAVIEEAKALFLVNVVEIVRSNPQKVRAYDKIGDYAAEMKEKLLEREGLAFVCTNGAAAKGARDAFSGVLGGSANELLGERYIEEIF